jgi:exopolyphosphatase/guanosine-5'-triphosphate,3'-diphosphate pyrophosphatase
VKKLTEKYGIIDIGSNTMRLVIYKRGRSGRLREIENVKVVARLRNYLTDDDELTEEGIRVLLEGLFTFQEVTRFHRLTNVKCVATATLRQARNRNEIVRLVAEQTDFHIRILSEYEEAYYGFLAVVNSTSLAEGITIDIGGGSTEVTYFRNRELIDYHSFPFGALSLKRQFVSGNIPTEEELKKISSYVTEQFHSLDWLKNKKLPIIAIGGSARNLVQIHQVLKNYPIAGIHQYEMDWKDIVTVKKYLTSLTFEQLQKVEGLSKDRADLIIPAIEVFQTLYETVDAKKFILSRKGLRDGIFYEQFIQTLGTSIFPSVLEESFFELAQDYELNVDHVRHVTKLVIQLFEQIRNLSLFPLTGEDLVLLKRAAHVFYLGQYIDEEASSQHTFYILANRTIDGLSHRDRVKLALIASFKNKTVFKQYVKPFETWFSRVEQKQLRFLGALLKFAYSLNDTKRHIVQQIKIEIENENIMIHLFCNRSWRAEEYQAEKHKKHLEKMLKRSIELKFHFLDELGGVR